MGAQVGMFSLHEQYKQFFVKVPFVAGLVTQYLFAPNGVNLDTVSLVDVELWSFVSPFPVTNLSMNIYSSAIAPGGANISVGVFKNGVIQGAWHTHNGTTQPMTRVFSVAAGDVVSIRGYTANVGVVCRFQDAYIGKFGMSQPRSMGFFHYYIDGSG